MLTKRELNFDFFSTPGYWHRVNAGKKVAGVCTGIAKQLDSSILILPLRLFFILTTVFYGFGVIFYIILWILMPSPTDPASGGEKPMYVSSAEPVSEEVSPASAQDTEEADSPDSPQENEAKMISLPHNFAMLAIVVVLLLCVYVFVLENVMGVTVSPFLLFSGFIFGGILLGGTVVALFIKKLHIPLSKVN